MINYSGCYDAAVRQEETMAHTMKSLGIDKLTVAERMALVEEIWNSIADGEEQVPSPQWHLDELKKRIEAYDANPTKGSSWEDVKARIRGKA
jgi:putative addiction module component (TIGR02574 family)